MYDQKNAVKIRAVIVEDESNNRENLLNILQQHCPMVEVAALCSSALDGRNKIMEFHPDLVFLDVEMPGGDGFYMLESLPEHNFEVIFVTAFTSYAVKAIKFSALDYIVKPIDAMELLGAVDKAISRIHQKHENDRIHNLVANQYRNDNNKLIALPLSDRIEFIEISTVIRCQADGNYTLFFIKNGDRLLISKTLKEFDELLTPYNFLRVHQSHLINLNEIKSFIKTDGGYILMKDNSSVPISRQRREMVLKHLNQRC